MFARVASLAAFTAALAVCPRSDTWAAEWRAIHAESRHLRSGGPEAPREWEQFPAKADRGDLLVHFDAQEHKGEHTLRLRQRDVKQAWRVRLNGTSLGTLVQDENKTAAVYAVPAGLLRARGNELHIAPEAGPRTPPDDIEISEVELAARPRAEVLAEASLRVNVVDGDTGRALPCRVTIVDGSGALAATGSASSPSVAVRPGVFYSGDGRPTAALPAGRYTVYAGRGFEYSVASNAIELAAGQSAERTLTVRRVVPTAGYVCCDTHVHTLTYSRHGDATLDERVLTLAGEGVELAVATEHNLQVDYADAAERSTVRRHFTPVRGNEVTTPALGHFNVFPIGDGSKLVNWRPRDWAALNRSIDETAPGAVVVLNHARDVHGGFAPFDPRRHVSVAGEPVDGRTPPANAMEVMNSGATRADPLELFRDWFGMLNRGHRLAPVGASDSHDVSRYIVGQARTYVSYGDDADPAAIDPRRAAAAIAAGRVAVSYGLLTQITVDGRFASGDLAAAAAPAASLPERGAEHAGGAVAGGAIIRVDVRVLGPEWVTASRVALYANGAEVRHADIPAAGAAEQAPVEWEGSWTLPRPEHDVHLVAIATGPGVTAPYWPGAKPYQPTSPRWQGYVLGATGAVFVDADRNGQFDSAHDYATRLVDECAAASGGNAERLPALLAARLERYDAAVAAQTASVLRARYPGDFEAICRRLIDAVPDSTARGAATYLEQWKQTK